MVSENHNLVAVRTQFDQALLPVAPQEVQHLVCPARVLLHAAVPGVDGQCNSSSSSSDVVVRLWQQSLTTASFRHGHCTVNPQLRLFEQQAVVQPAYVLVQPWHLDGL